MLGGTLFLIWLIRSKHLPTVGANTTKRFARAIRIATQIGLIVFPATLLANVFGYVNLANLLWKRCSQKRLRCGGSVRCPADRGRANHYIAGGAPLGLMRVVRLQPADASAAYLWRC